MNEYNPQTMYVTYNWETRQLEEHQTPNGLTIRTKHELVNNNNKIFIRLEESFFHYIVETLPLIIKVIQTKTPNTELVIYTQQSETHKNLNNPTKYALDLCTQHGIKYTLINFTYDKTQITHIPINNYKFETANQGDHNYEEEHLPTLANFFNTTRTNNQKPYRKTYLSRNKVVWRHPNDYRTNNETELETYFANHGFEIICPEDFTTFQEQLDYMSEVKTLISLTSAGLTNVLFMQDGQNQVELQVKLTTPIQTMSYTNFKDTIHNHYLYMGHVKNHTMTTIPNNRNAQQIIKQFETKPHLKALLNE